MASTSLTFDLYAKDHASSTFRSFGSGVDNSTRAVSGLRAGLSTLAKAFIGLAIIQKTTEFLSDSIAEGREANKVSAQTEAVLKSTGHAAKMNGQEISDLANKISMKAGIDDEAIQSAENMLLTFKNVRDEVGKGNDVFSRGTQVITDMSVAMGKDLNSTSVMVGKALNDPIAGITALTRVGVTFSTKQKDTIKTLVETGDTLSAQKLILKELNSEFKGSAKAQADPADKAKVAWENLQETIGLKLMPILDKLLIWFTKEGLPAVMRFGSFLSSTLGPVISQVASWFSGASSEGGKLSSAFQSLISAGQGLYNGLKPIAIDIFNRIKENWPQIKATIATTLSAIAGVITSVTTLITTIWDKFGDTIMTVAGNTFSSVMRGIQNAMRVIQGIIMVVTGIIKGDWSQVWQGIKQIVGAVWDQIKNIIGNAVKNVKAILGGLAGAIRDKIVAAWSAAVSATVSWIAKMIGKVKALPGKIKSAIGNLGKVLYNAGVQVVQGLIDGMNSMAGALTAASMSLAEKVASTFGLGMEIQSPSKVMHKHGVNVVQGLIDGIKSKISELKDAMQGVTDSLKSSFEQSVFGQGFTDVKSMKQFGRAQLNSVKQLAKDVPKLIKWGLSDSLIQQLIASGDFAGIHALATSSKADVKDLSRITNRTEKLLNQVGGQAGNELYGDQLARQEKMLERATEKGMERALNGAKFVLIGGDKVRLITRSTAH